MNVANNDRNEHRVGFEFGVSNEEGIGNNLANETAYHCEGTWYLDRWIPGTGMVMNLDQECAGSTRECVALFVRNSVN